MSAAHFSLIACGHALPERRLSSEELERRARLPAGWIERRTGIRERPIAAQGESTGSLAVAAGRHALAQAAIDPAAIRLVILATSTPDKLLPPTAPAVAHQLGLTGAGAIDLAGACSGFLYGLTLADSFCRVHGGYALVIAANVLSRRLNWDDPNTTSLFADGAGAVVWGPTARPVGLRGVFLGADGSREGVVVPEGGSLHPVQADTFSRGAHLMQLDHGPSLFRHAVHGMAEAGRHALERAGLANHQIDWWIPHQANHRLIRDAGKLLAIPPGRTINLIRELGNSSAATIPTALSIAHGQGRFREGQQLLLTAFGAGMISSGLVMTL